MNPITNFNINNFKETLVEIERLGKFEYLRDLEDKIIQRIVFLIGEGTEEAKIELIKIEDMIKADLKYAPRNSVLISALKNSISGALSIAKLCLL
jgi:hypothetical protein